MQRIEPSIGRTDLPADPHEVARLQAQTRARRRRKAAVDVLVNLGLFVLIVAVAGGLAWNLGLAERLPTFSGDHAVARILVVAGVLLLFATQFIAAAALLVANPMR